MRLFFLKKAVILLMFYPLMSMTTAVARNGSIDVAIVLDDQASGYLVPDENSAVIFTYKKLERLTIINSKNSHLMDGKYVHVKGTQGKRASKNVGVIPDLWVKTSHVISRRKMKKWSSCWPIKKLFFVDGVIDVDIDLKDDGTGFIKYSEGNGQPTPVSIYSYQDVVDVRDSRNVISYFFNLDSSSTLSAPDIEIVNQITRDCRAKHK